MINEEAQCKYRSFDFETSGNLMTKDGNVHVSASNLYWVICKDAFGNKMQPARIQFT